MGIHPVSNDENRHLRGQIQDLPGQFTHKGSVTVSAHIESGDAYADVQAPFAFIEVADTGIGIGADDQKRLFKDFHRVETGLTSNYEGVGLGLTLSKKFIELHAGKINVKSDLGKGSSFTIILPSKREPVNSEQ